MHKSENRKPSPSKLHAIARKVYVTDSSAPVVFKASTDDLSIRRQYDIQGLVSCAFLEVTRDLDCFGSNFSLPRIPRCYEHFDDTSASSLNQLFETQSIAHSSAYSMEYIRPLSKRYTKSLLRQHLTPKTFERAWEVAKTESVLFKVYLGDPKPLHDMDSDTVRDRPAYLDHLSVEGANVDHLAASMGAALAILHWICGIDARGVHFLLGADKSGRLHTWIVNFGHCHLLMPTIDAVQTQLVDAIRENEPFWPRYIDVDGFRGVWASFTKKYLRVSRVLVEKNHKHLPAAFIDSLNQHHGRERG